MANWIVEDRITGEVAYAYGADQPDHFGTFPLEQYNHIKQKEIAPEPVPRWVTKLEFVARLGEPAMDKLIELSMTEPTILKFVKMIDWASVNQDQTSINLDDQRTQKVSEFEPLLVSLGVVNDGWATEVLA